MSSVYKKVLPAMLRPAIILSLFFFPLKVNAQNPDIVTPKSIVGIWERYYIEARDSGCAGCEDLNYKNGMGIFEFKKDGKIIYSGVMTMNSDSAEFTGSWSLEHGILQTKIDFGNGPYQHSYRIRFIKQDLFYEARPFLAPGWWINTVFVKTKQNLNANQ